MVENGESLAIGIFEISIADSTLADFLMIAIFFVFVDLYEAFLIVILIKECICIDLDISECISATCGCLAICFEYW